MARKARNGEGQGQLAKKQSPGKGSKRAGPELVDYKLMQALSMPLRAEALAILTERTPVQKK